MQEDQAANNPATDGSTPTESESLGAGLGAVSGIKKSQASRNFTISVCLLLLLSMCVFWLISSYHTQNLLRQQADDLGQTLANQTAVQLTELVLANDLISMNVVLGNITRGSSIIEVAVLNIDNEIIAISSGSPARDGTTIPLPFELNTLEGEYTAAISLLDSIAGYVRLRLDLSYIEEGLASNFLFIVAATILLLLAAAALTITYFRYLISFPINLLAYSISNIRAGKIDTCPEPDNNNEISAAIRQFNATAEFLAQNTFLDNIGQRKPEVEEQQLKFQPGKQDVTLLNVNLSNFHFLASTLSEELMVNLLNKYYFFAGKVAQLYNGHVSFCADGELVMNFDTAQVEEEQAFYAICAGQLMLQLVGDLSDVGGEHVAAKFRLSVHSGQAISGLYSPITQETNNLTGETLDMTRKICDECPDNAMLISAACFAQAGAGSRIDAKVFSEFASTAAGDSGEGPDAESAIFLSREPMFDYRLLLERQAIQLVTLYPD